MRIRSSLAWAATAVVVAAFASPHATAQAVQAPFTKHGQNLDSGYLPNPGATDRVVFSGRVRIDQARWLRLDLDRSNLPAGSRLRLTSAFDGAVQWFDGRSLADYRYRSAYFNGNEVVVDLIAAPGTVGNRVTVPSADAGDASVAWVPESLCGADDRILSDDPRQGRQFPTGCTAWLINEFTVLTAGHCTSNQNQSIHFNVPLSTSSGSLVMPPPEDQYPYDVPTLQRLFNRGNGQNGIGEDWTVTRALRNSNTGLWPGQAQGDWYELGPVPSTTAGQVIRITGYGTVSSPVARSWNQAQKTHADSLTDIQSTYLRYIPDTTGGNSGSPVIHENTGYAVGIHTHAGCTTGGNHGTRIDRPDIQAAVASISTSITAARFRAFGAGCAGTVGTPELGNTGFPEVGSSYSIDLGGLRPNQPGGLFFGFSNTTGAGGVPLPRDLGVIGMGGCEQLVSFDISLPLATGAGTTSTTLNVANDPTLVGATYFVQYFHVDNGANALGVVASNAAEVVVGN